jgi:hypothetical protein
MKKLFRMRATDRDADLIVVTDEDVTVDPGLTLKEALVIITKLCERVQSQYRALEREPAVVEDRPIDGEHAFS